MTTTSLDTPVSTVAAMAATYIARGWDPFPLHPRSKLPVETEWQRRTGICDWSVDDIDEYIDRWWVRTDHNIGLNCSNLTVVDADTPEAHRVIIDALGYWPAKVPQVATSRGTHLYFQGADLGNRARAAGVKLDARGVGGFVVAPPSIHPSGVTYRWVVEREHLFPLPEEVRQLIWPPAPACPPSVFSVLNTKGYAAAALRHESDIVRNAADGERNHRLNIAALKLSRFIPNELRATEVVETLLEAANANGLIRDDGERAARATIASGLRGGHRA